MTSMTHEDGSIALVYDARGNVITGAATLDAGLPGQWFQLESGLHYNWHRHYDPTFGRYTQPDPLGFVDGPSVYGYAVGSPAMAVDPDGRLILWPTTDIYGGILGGLDFLRNYSDMRTANFIQSDKYFHCKANCEASKRGRGGYAVAICISNTREWYDATVKGYPRSDSTGDHVANVMGRIGAKLGQGQSCARICQFFRPPGLPTNF